MKINDRLKNFYYSTNTYTSLSLSVTRKKLGSFMVPQINPSLNFIKIRNILSVMLFLTGLFAIVGGLYT